ncbi:dephospho-CoA kinase [Paenalcaligenes faecalis]|uniref:dephospho-CoA kinase n=1 Tax=Paenalcaligenes faecalis TaxID=2980099 RepID=UPI0022B970D6|nr:dephospho-CoA kinase [Paenalcaligenes faecalis]
MQKIGLTGGIGSGKSYVADLFQQWGATVVDTDVIAHQLTAPAGAAIEPIRQHFGDAFITEQGAMNRDRMRDLVFKHPLQRQDLQNILHPLIRDFTFRQVEQAQGCYVVVVVPLLIESGSWASYVDRVCVVDCDEATQINRVVQRNGLTPEQIQRIMQAQATRQQRLAVADDVIVNDVNTSLEQLTIQAQQLHNQWCKLS